VDVSLGDMTSFEQALSSDDIKNAAMAAHSIKGAAGNLGFTKISAAADAMENAAKAGDLSNIEEHINCIKAEIEVIKKALPNP